MSNFDKALARTVGVEGGYTNDPLDSGKETNYGITVAVARAFGYTGGMNDMPLDIAHAIYRKNYWDLLKLDSVDALSPSIAAEMFDTGVNCGVYFAAESLQRALNALNREQADYADMTVDGLIGNDTIAALGTFLLKRKLPGERVLLKALNSMQGARYINIVEKRPKDESFLFGWFLNRVVLP